MDKIVKDSSSKFILFDNSFIVSLVYKGDSNHNQAITTFKIIREREKNVVYLLQETCLLECVTVLLTSGFEARDIENLINNLVRLPKVIINNTNLLSAMRYTQPEYRRFIFPDEDHRIPKPKIRKTNDFLIACTALDYNAVVITSDSSMYKSLELNGILVFNFTEHSFGTLKLLLEE